MADPKSKREVPAAVKTLLNVDVALTNKFCSFCENFMTFRSLRTHYKALELTGHGVLWFAGWLVFIYLANKSSLYQMQVNLYIGLILDIIIVGVTKAVTRRRRPVANQNDMPGTVGPDVFSFPSGHATRTVFIASFFSYLYPLPLPVQLPLIAWSAAICVSRVLLRRHHLLDVTAGIGIGFLETFLVSLIWLDQDSSAYIIAWLADDATTAAAGISATLLSWS